MTGQLDMFSPVAVGSRNAEPEQPAKPLTITERFEAFHAAHPEVLAEMLRLARARLARGETRIGAKALWEELRSSLELADDGKGEGAYRLNNTYVACYSRRLIEIEPALGDVIETRQRKAK